MAVDGHAVATATYWDTVADIGTNTNRPDVSDMLDLWAHKDTPFLNKINWGPDSGGLNIEWVSEHLGFGYLSPACEATTASTAVIIGASGLANATAAMEQVTTGTLLFVYDSTTSEYGLMWVESMGSSNSIAYSWVAVTASTNIDLTTASKLYILGDVANEGSGPRDDKSRVRSVITNAMAILREDVQITGSMAATDFYAVENELKHQISNRLIEMQRHREMLMLLAKSTTRSATLAGLFDGAFGFLEGKSGSDWVKDSSLDFTESAVNDLAAEVYENGGNPDCLVGSVQQLRKFTRWDQNKVRTSTDAKIAGHYITQYLTDTGATVDLVMLRKFPVNIVFCLDTQKIKLRAKKGRKLLVEKLGIDGDRERWQMISEFTVEFRGYDKGQQAMWSKLNA
jgi:hypothetical protein